MSVSNEHNKVNRVSSKSIGELCGPSSVAYSSQDQFANNNVAVTDSVINVELYFTMNCKFSALMGLY